MRAIAVIPARYGSTRFPAKALARQTGKYLVQHVYERVRQAASIDQVLIATDDQRIADAVRSFGGDPVMTRSDHATGTDRVAEVAASDPAADIVLNVQGDEPEVEPYFLDRLVDRLTRDPGCPVATPACPFARIAGADPSQPSAVKVIMDQRQRAIYFSRSLIPYPRNRGVASEGEAGPFLHLGVYAYRRAFLLEMSSWAPTPLEQTESLEQLRILEHGYDIAVVLVEHACVGIDTPDDYAAFVRRVATPAGAAR